MPSPPTAKPSSAHPAADHDAEKETPASLLRFLLSLALLAWALRSLVLQPFSIPSDSMLPALYIGDYIVVAKWPYGYSRYSFPWGVPSFSGRILGRLPKRGDVVVFRLPRENADLVKRVIGLPGDVIELRDGAVILNGEPLPRRQLAPVAMPISPNSPCRVVPPVQPRIAQRSGRQYCLYPAYAETLPGGPSYTVLDQVPAGPGDSMAPVRVPADRLFVMGDNRDDSLDSRFPADQGGVGMLPVDQVVGRATITFWSTDGSSSYFEPWTWFSALRAERIGNSYSEGRE